MGGILKSNFIQLYLKKQVEDGRRIPFREIVEKTGLSKATIHNYKQKEIKNFRMDTAIKLCEYFNCNFSDLIGHERIFRKTE